MCPMSERTEGGAPSARTHGDSGNLQYEDLFEVYCGSPVPQRALQQLDALLTSKVGVVQAPPGFGRQGLAEVWLRSGRPVIPYHLTRGMTVEKVTEDVGRLIGDSDKLVVLVASRAEVLAETDLLNGLIDVVLAATQLRMLVVCVHHPDIALGKVAVRRGLVVIGPLDLALTRIEVEALLRRQHPNIPTEDIEDVVRQSGGWLAAVHLYSPSNGLHERGDWQADMLASFIRSEILDPLSDSDREMLRRLSTMDVHDPQSARWVTDDPAVRDVLGRIGALGIPTAPPTNKNRVAILRPVRDVLLAELWENDPDTARALTERTVTWLHTHRQPLPAIQMAAERLGEDVSLPLMGEYLCAHACDSSLMAVLREFISMLPSSRWTPDLASILMSGSAVPQQLPLPLLESISRPLLEHPGWGEISYSVLRFVTARAEVYPADFPLVDASEIATRYRHAELAGPELAMNACAQIERGLHLVNLGRFTEATPLLEQFTDVARAVGQCPYAILGLGAQAWIEAERGEGARAITIAIETIRYAKDHGLADCSRLDYAHLALMSAHIERGELEDAMHWYRIDKQIPVHEAETWPMRIYVGGMMEMFQGQSSETMALLGSYDRADPNRSAYHQSLTETTRVYGFLLEGRLKEAAEASASLPAPGPNDDGWPLTIITRAHVVLAQGDAAHAYEILRPCAAGPSDAMPHSRDNIYLLNTYASLADMVGLPAESESAHRRAEVMAARLGLDSPTARNRRIASTGRTIEPLTEAERNVLAALDVPLTLNQIADSLFISINTLKTHLRQIYRKLGVANREEAVAHSRTIRWMDLNTPNRGPALLG